jgi:hypothetical protein
MVLCMSRTRSRADSAPFPDGVETVLEAWVLVGDQLYGGCGVQDAEIGFAEYGWAQAGGGRAGGGVGECGPGECGGHRRCWCHGVAQDRADGVVAAVGGGRVQRHGDQLRCRGEGGGGQDGGRELCGEHAEQRTAVRVPGQPHGAGKDGRETTGGGSQAEGAVALVVDEPHARRGADSGGSGFCSHLSGVEGPPAVRHTGLCGPLP